MWEKKTIILQTTTGNVRDRIVRIPFRGDMKVGAGKGEGLKKGRRSASSAAPFLLREVLLEAAFVRIHLYFQHALIRAVGARLRKHDATLALVVGDREIRVLDAEVERDERLAAGVRVDRKSVVSGKDVAGRLVLVGRRIRK